MYKAILLSLNVTLISDWRVSNRNMSRENWIRDHEEYNSWVIDWLSEVDSQVYIFTSRDAEYKEETLEAISMRLSWKPDGAYFNDNTGYDSADVARVKSTLLKRLLEDTGLKLDEVYIFESNDDACRMWKRRGVPHKKVTKPSHLPCIEWFTESGE